MSNVISQQLHTAGIVAALKNDSAYPHPVSSLDVRQTHTSYVILTGKFAYKIKKPVNFGFLDYSTLDRRMEMCREEVRLNDPYCPGVYLDVVPITDENGRITVGGGGRIVEWAIRMSQLDEREMLSSRLSAAAVERRDIERIADAVVELHSQPPIDPSQSRRAEPHKIAVLMSETCDTMDKLTGDDRNSRYLVRSYLDNFVAEHAALLSRRVEEGRIRDCHGDLRTQNICLDKRFGSGVQLFDRIEFNNDLRYIDPVADLAYLAMDLDFAGRLDLGTLLIDSYRRGSPNHDLETLLPFYRTYRAVVRGNIAALAAGEIELPSAERDRHAVDAVAAYDLARSYAGGRPHPALLVTLGFVGSGKSTLAREVARRLPAVLLSSDLVRAEIAMHEPSGTDLYSPEKRAHVYDEMRHRAIRHLTQGHHVILDATFLSAEEQVEAAYLASSEGAEFWILECHCPEAVIRQRLKAPRGSRQKSDANERVYDRQKNEFGAAASRVTGHPNGLVAVDTAQPVDKAAHDVVRRFLSMGE